MSVVGITATRHGLTDLQSIMLSQALRNLEAHVLHHGDCVGGDHEADVIAQHMKIMRIAHPPNDPKLRAFCSADVILDEKPYLDRNKDIVNECEVLIALPQTAYEQQRSGTWSTVRYARQINKPHVIIYPDGSVEEGGPGK